VGSVSKKVDLKYDKQKGGGGGAFSLPFFKKRAEKKVAQL